MRHIRAKIDGTPYCRTKARGKIAAAHEWSRAVVEQTRQLPHVAEACLLRVTFRLPHDKFPKDFPYGPDLDNLLKRLMDALCETVFSGSRGGDSCVVALEAMKVVIETEPGVDLEILPITAG